MYYPRSGAGVFHRRREDGEIRPFFLKEREFLLPYIAIFLSFAAVAAGVAIDQVLKSVVTQQLKPLGQIELIPGFFNLTYVENRGAAFGMLANHQWLFIVVTAVVCVAIAAALIFYQNHTALTRTALTLVLAGGIGNMIDRLHYQYVVDYIHFQFFPPVFNFADICVTVGCALLIIYLLFFTDEKGSPRQPGRYSKYAHYNQNRNHRMGG